MSHASSGADSIAAADRRARTKQCLQKRFGRVRSFQIQRETQADALESLPQPVSLNRDAAAIELDDEATPSICGIERCLQHRVDFLEEPVNFSAPVDDQPALSQERLRLVLESRRIALAEAIDARLRFDASDSGDRLVQLARGHA